MQVLLVSSPQFPTPTLPILIHLLPRIIHILRSPIHRVPHHPQILPQRNGTHCQHSEQFLLPPQQKKTKNSLILIVYQHITERESEPVPKMPQVKQRWDRVRIWNLASDIIERISWILWHKAWTKSNQVHPSIHYRKEKGKDYFYKKWGDGGSLAG